MYEMINEELRNNFYEDPMIKVKLNQLEKQVLKGEISPYFAAQKLSKND